MKYILNFLKNLFFVSGILIILGASGFAQSEADLEVSSLTSSQSVRGGEKLIVTVTVNNVGQKSAENVYFGLNFQLQDSIVSAIPNRGKCEIQKGNQHVVCRLENLKNGESVSAAVEIKVDHFGDISQPANDDRLPDISPGNLPVDPLGTITTDPVKNLSQPDGGRDIDIYFFANSESIDANRENDDGRITIRALPSKNIPPRVELVSPKNESVRIKPLNKTLEIPLVIKAFDPDGKITKVRVVEQNFQIIFEDNQYKFVFGDKKYTGQEAEDHKEELAQYFGGDAAPNGDGTYGYIWKNLRYGRNRVFIEAEDDGERGDVTYLDIEVKSDATIEVVSPKKDRIVSPGSTVTFETISKFGEGVTPQIRIMGMEESPITKLTDLPVMKQVSKNGNVYKHQFTWKVPEERDFDFSIIALENGEETNITETFRIIGAYPRVIKFVSLKNGQVFDSAKPIEIKIEARDSRGVVVPDEFDLLIDGKKFVEMNNSLCEQCFPKSYIWRPPFLKKGTHTIQVIAKTWRNVELGKSELISIIIN